MKIKSIRLIKNEKGASAVEFAIILPILIMLVFGIFQFGIAYNTYITITHAAREGARIAAVDLDPYDHDPLIDIIIERANNIITKDNITINHPDPAVLKIGDPVEVIITYKITIEIPLLPPWENITLTSRAVMRLENYK